MGVFQSGINNILGQAASIGSKVAKAQAQKQADIKLANEKLDIAQNMAVGYDEVTAQAIQNQKTLGLKEHNKKPRGVQQKAYDRRMANVNAMQEIREKFIQNKEYRDRILNSSREALAATLKPQINKKLEDKSNGQK